MPIVLSAEQKKAADAVLARLDKVAQDIMTHHESWGLSLEAAKPLVNHLDKIADSLEADLFGPESLLKRQVELMKTAALLQHDSDEPYMQTFANPMSPHQTDSDEPYMQAYGDDDSSAVRGGKTTTGRPLT